MNYKLYKKELENFINTSNPSKQEIISFIKKYEEEYPKYNISIRKAAFSILKDSYTLVALETIEPYLDKIEDINFLKSIQKRYKRLKLLEKSSYVEKLIKKLLKKKLVDEIEDDFKQNLKVQGINYSMRELEKTLSKYYYLERTVLKRIYKFLKNLYPEEALKIADRVNEKFGDRLI